MTNYDLEEDRLLKYQICLSIILIFTIIISIILSFNAMMECEKKDKIYSDIEAETILRISRIIALFVAVGFMLINVYDKYVKEKNNLENKNADIQIVASAFTLASSLIVLYVAFNNSNQFVAEENPGV